MGKILISSFSNRDFNFTSTNLSCIAFATEAEAETETETDIPLSPDKLLLPHATHPNSATMLRNE